MATERDPYDVLGVASTATDADIRLAFRKKAAAFHPDRNPAPDAAARFREAQQAYELLSDAERRRAHDERRRRRLLEDPDAVAGALFRAYVAEFE